MVKPKVAIYVDEDDARILKEFLRELRSLKAGNKESPQPEITQAPHGIVAFSPSGGIPKADDVNLIVYGALCDMYREVAVPGYSDRKQLQKITKPNGSAWQQMIFHLDSSTDVGGSKPLITFPTKWGTRFVLWEACSEWDYYGY